MYACRENVSGLFYTRRDGAPTSLAECWQWVEGCGGMSIVNLATGRVVLTRAGDCVGRRYAVRRMYRDRVRARRDPWLNPAYRGE